MGSSSAYLTKQCKGKEKERFRSLKMSRLLCLSNVRILMNRRRAVTQAVVLALAVVVILSLLTRGSDMYDGKFSEISVASSRKVATNPSLRYFKQIPGRELFLYSAIANTREPEEGEMNVIITAFDSTGTDNIHCCVLLRGGKVYSTRATVFYQHYLEDILGPFFERFKETYTHAKEFACVVPHVGLVVEHVTLTPKPDACPLLKDEYLPVIYPKSVPGGLAVCAKTVFGDELDPNMMMEWFETLRLLGVDHVQLMDLNCPEDLQKVFKYYKDMGLLNALPFELPGRPYNRGLDQPHWVQEQASHDESFSVMECKQRLQGYSYVLGHDVDEVLMPARHSNIKDLLEDYFTKKPDAAGFYFYTQFFVYDWGPTNPRSDMTLLRYLNSTLPRNECKKYAYLPNRVSQAKTHHFSARPHYKSYFVPIEDAILHHYRKCPRHVWRTCDEPRMTDRSMLRFQEELKERVEKARQATGIRPKL